MVMDTADQPLNEFDWQVLSMRPFQGVRMNIPMPSKKDDLHTIAYRLAKLAEELHSLARYPGRNRSAIIDAAGLVREQHQSFKRLGKEWEKEYRELQEAEQNVVDLKEHVADVKRTTAGAK